MIDATWSKLKTYVVKKENEGEKQRETDTERKKRKDNSRQAKREGKTEEGKPASIKDIKS